MATAAAAPRRAPWILLPLLLAACGTSRDVITPPDAAPSAATPARSPADGGADPTARVADPSLDADLALLRAHDQRAWSPAANPAMRAAVRVFAAIDFEGKTTTEVERLLGPPMSKEEGDTVWTYAYHNGLVGAVRRLHIVSGKVARVETVMTQ